MQAAEPPEFTIEIEERGEGAELRVARDGAAGHYSLGGGEQQDYFALFAELSRDFHIRRPHCFEGPDEAPMVPDWRPLITENLDPRIRSGYGDPAVFQAGGDYVLAATSNDAPDAFPLLVSSDLENWRPSGFVFPRGSAPGWTAQAGRHADFWAPEMARVGDEYWLAYTARDRDRKLAIGLARADTPLGPWTDNGEPLLGGGGDETPVIDAHIFVDGDGSPWLFWKCDSNALWPRPLARLLGRRPDLAQRMFEAEEDRRTAAFAAAIEPWANSRRPMERFFLMHPLIEAVIANWAGARRVLAECAEAAAIVDAMQTRVLAQPIAADGRSLAGHPVTVLVNDLDWEGHLIEGPFVTLQDGRYWLFYAGNDFSTPAYGIGVAVSDSLLGPYIKQGEPLLRSSRDWWGPGHPTVAPGLDGRPQMFFHAFRPGRCGYNEFRALLTVGLDFGDGRVSLRAV